VDRKMRITKTLKIPVHFAITKLKQSILDNTTARITFCIQNISSLITDDTELTRKTIRLLARTNKVAETTKLSAGFVDQCIDKAIWSWKSYKKLHDRNISRRSQHYQISTIRHPAELMNAQAGYKRISEANYHHYGFTCQPCRKARLLTFR